MSLRDIQTRLQLAGVYTGAIDGLWGRGTEAGVSAALDHAGVPVAAAPPPTLVIPAKDAHPTSAQYTIQTFIRHFIDVYEGGLSMDPKDTGNYFRGQLIGSKYGVTGAALAKFRGVSTATAHDIATLTEDEAIQVGLRIYYDEPDFDIMPWDPIMASVMDHGWMAGPKQAIKLLQRMCAAGDDGVLGAHTDSAYRDYQANHGLRQTAIDWCHVREGFFELIIQRRPSNAKYRKGWQNRARSFLPGTPWWDEWKLPPQNH